MKSKQNQSPLRNKLSFILFYEICFLIFWGKFAFSSTLIICINISFIVRSLFIMITHTHVHPKPISKIENSSKREANIAKLLFIPVALYDFSLITTKCLVGTICLQKYFYSFFWARVLLVETKHYDLSVSLWSFLSFWLDTLLR